jgi:hypothetical protein
LDVLREGWLAPGREAGTQAGAGKHACVLWGCCLLRTSAPV